MKKFLKLLIVIIALICLVYKLDILGFFVLNASDEQLARYNGYYFNKLDLEEKNMYVKIDEAVKQGDKKVFLGFHKDIDIKEKLSKIIQAYFYDNPECYYISNKYGISTADLKFSEYSILELEYLTASDAEIEIKDQELENAIDKLLERCITDDMSDFEKELAIHDALAENVEYYKYEDINEIPCIKHTAYGALVEKQAVCDGYSKAFKILLDRVGIENIIIHGSTENVAHAWNLVKLDDDYYHVDVTSDKVEEKGKKYVVHTYFNINDEQLSKTHKITNEVIYPKSIALKYDYFNQTGYQIQMGDILYSKLNEIVSKQQNTSILEFKVDNQFSSRRIIDTLYDMNFNNWKYSGKTSVEYNQMQEVYVIIK